MIQTHHWCIQDRHDVCDVYDELIYSGEIYLGDSILWNINNYSIPIITSQ